MHQPQEAVLGHSFHKKCLSIHAHMRGVVTGKSKRSSYLIWGGSSVFIDHQAGSYKHWRMRYKYLFNLNTALVMGCALQRILLLHLVKRLQKQIVYIKGWLVAKQLLLSKYKLHHANIQIAS